MKWLRRTVSGLDWRWVFLEALRDLRDSIYRGWIIMIGVGVAHFEVWPEVRPIGFGTALFYGILSVLLFPAPWRKEEDDQALSDAEKKLAAVLHRRLNESERMR